MEMKIILVLEYNERGKIFHYNYGTNRENPEWITLNDITEPITEDFADEFCDHITMLYIRRGMAPSIDVIKNDYECHKLGQLKNRVEVEVEKLYLIWAKGTNKFKVGVSKTPVQRLTTIQTGCPFECELLYSFISPVNDARIDEKTVHSEFSSFKSHGEWLSLTKDALIYLLESHFEMRDYITFGSQNRAEMIADKCFGRYTLSVRSTGSYNIT